MLKKQFNYVTMALTGVFFCVLGCSFVVESLNRMELAVYNLSYWYIRSSHLEINQLANQLFAVLKNASLSF